MLIGCAEGPFPRPFFLELVAEIDFSLSLAHLLVVLSRACKTFINESIALRSFIGTRLASVSETHSLSTVRFRAGWLFLEHIDYVDAL